MVCRACGGPARDLLCPSCGRSLHRGGERRLACGLIVSSSLVHQGAARALVHNLKYGGLSAAAEVLAVAMERVMPPDAECLVPVPRVLGRLWRYGIDPSAALSRVLARRTGLPVEPILARPLWWAGRAGPAGVARGDPVFRAVRAVPPRAVLVDDVITTGATLGAAAGALPGVSRAITATGPADGGRGR